MDQVAIVNRHIEAPLRDEILIYRYDGSARWLATFDVQTQPVTHLFWSPSGRYLTISNGCASLTISDCLQIRDMQTGDVIWDGNRLGETISGGRYLDTSSIYWLNDESEFLLLGHFMNEDERSYLWYLSLDEHQPRARWEIPSSLRYIIDINSVNHER
jgi:WD40 repeat protein